MKNFVGDFFIGKLYQIVKVWFIMIEKIFRRKQGNLFEGQKFLLATFQIDVHHQHVHGGRRLRHHSSTQSQVRRRISLDKRRRNFEHGCNRAVDAGNYGSQHGDHARLSNGGSSRRTRRHVRDNPSAADNYYNRCVVLRFNCEKRKCSARLEGNAMRRDGVTSRRGD